MKDDKSAYFPAPLLLILTNEPDSISSRNEMIDLLGNDSWILRIHPNTNSNIIAKDPDCILFDIVNLEPNQWVEIDLLYQRYAGRHIGMLAVARSEDCLTFLRKLPFLDEILPDSASPDIVASRVAHHIKKRGSLMEQLLVDPVTGAYTDRFLVVELQKQLHDLRRSHEPFSMVHLILDDLLTVNRTFGQLAAEMLKRQFVSIFKQSMRPTDSIFHYVNEAFILILPLTVKDDAFKFMKRMTEFFADRIITLPTTEMHASFSARVVEFADATQPPEDCLALMPFAEDGSIMRQKGMLIDGMEESGYSYVKKLKIAIIDDDRIIRELLSQQLTDLGLDDYEIETRSFADGEQYFDDPWHRQNERFIVIIDRIMPKMDGIEVLQKIRANYDRRRYLCVMLTSRDSETEIAMAIQSGANDYITKPFSLKELRARLRRLMRGLR